MVKKRERTYFLEQVRDTAILQLYSDGFEKLNKCDRLKAYYFIEACLAGRDIYYDQNHRHALEIRTILEEIITHPHGINYPLLESIKNYTKLFWINNCQYNERSKEKIVPDFTFPDLCKAIEMAINDGATISIPKKYKSIQEYLKRFEKTIFDPNFEPLITNKNPKRKNDILSESSVNFYYNISISDLDNFTERFPLNSRLIKKNNELIEQVFRAGDGEKGIPQGLYSRELDRVITNLQKSLLYANNSQKKAILCLIEFFKTGDLDLFDQFNIEWLKGNSLVDIILGFIEVYKDPRGRKGSFEGIVFCVDPEMTQLMQKLSQNAQYFEDNAPWNEKYKKEHKYEPTALAVSVLFGIGGSGPTPPLGINLPNSDKLRQKYGSKSVLLTNVLRAINGATGQKIIDEFAWSEARPLLRKYSVLSENLHVALHEILGHGSGKLNPALTEDPAYYLKEYHSTIEEARADLNALYSIFDPKIVELGLMPNEKVAHAEYWRYITSDLAMLRRIKTDEIEDDHMRATHMIISYISDQHNAIEHIEEKGKIYLKITSIKRMHEGVEALLTELMRIKAEGDYKEARKIITKYGVKYNKNWRDQVLQRSSDIGLPEYFAFVMPTFIPILDNHGEILDIKIEYNDDFQTQMLKYSNKWKN